MPSGDHGQLLRMAKLAAGPLLYFVLASLTRGEVGPAGSHVLGVAGWMAVWWITEAVPLAVTSLLPIALFPLLGATSTAAATAPYANELVFLFLAGFLLATALQRWGAHRRIAYSIVLAIGTRGRRVVLGMMLATAFLSMWISNTATAAMMYPIAIAVGALFGTGRDADSIRTALMLGVAYAASIGGMATLIGTPPNLLFAGAVREFSGVEVGFASFMAVGLPVTLLMIPATWALLVYVLHRGGGAASIGHGAAAEIRKLKAELGPISRGEAFTLAIFAGAAVSWLLRERKVVGEVAIPGLTDVFPGVTDASIGIAAALLLFIIRARTEEGSRPLLVWNEARTIPWEVLILFGGGLSLAAAMEATGVARWLGETLGGLAALPRFAIYAGFAAVILLFSELASNTATAAMAMPVAASVAAAIGEPPILLMLTAALAASTGFALPVATPPNAIVFGSGQVTVRQMARAGLLLDLIAIVLVLGAVMLLAPAIMPGG